MRVLMPMAILALSLAACAPMPTTTVTTVHAKPVQPRHPATVVVPTTSVQTVRPIRPDATGHFPGDYAAAWNARPAYEAAHIGGGKVIVAAPAAVPAGKYTPTGPAGKYTPQAPGGKYTPQVVQSVQGVAVVGARRPVPGHSAYEAHRVYRPPMDCYIISQSQPEPWVGKRYACVEH